LWALAITLLVLGALLQFITDPSQWSQVVWGVLAVVPSATVGVLLASRRAGNLIGWIFCLFALLAALQNFADLYAVYTLVTAPGSLWGGVALAWVGSWVLHPAVSLLGYLVLVFPNGRLPSHRWRLVVWLFTGVTALVTLSAALQPGPLVSVPTINNPLAVTGAASALALVGSIGTPLNLLFGSVFAASVILHFLRARGEERQQFKWLAYASILGIVWFGVSTLLQFLQVPVGDFASNVLWGLTFAGFPIAVGIAILKYRLYDIDLLINRTLVYGTLTACVVSVYVLIVGSLGVLFRSSENSLIAILATGLVALLFHPLRQRLQRGINRVMYGERDDPSAVLAHLGQRLEATLAPDAVLPTLVQTVREALRLPYAAIALAQGETFEVAASTGKPVPDTLNLPLVYQGETMGQLRLAARTPGEAFSAADRHVLHTIAYQAGAAVHTVHLTTELQRSRQHLVTAREEERQRLRRDLHDGLGPVLATMALQAEEARDQLPAASDQSAASLTDLITQAHGALDDIRRLVYALRPPALDALGLLGALKEQATQYARQDLSIVVDAPEHLPPLPAAVEVAAYRIIQEALTNVVRHAQACTCTVSVQVNDTLDLEVTDDGRGLPAACHAGVGLHSMRERAAELGGTFDITSTPGQGTRLRVSLPRHIG